MVDLETIGEAADLGQVHEFIVGNAEFEVSV